MEHLFLPLTSLMDGIGQSVTNDVFCLPVKIVNVCFVGNADQPQDFVLVDAGMPNSAAQIIGEAEERFGAGCRPKSIILTHGHFDHVGAVIELADHYGVPVYAHPLELPYLTGQADYPSGDPTVDGGLVSELSPWFPNEGINLDERIHALPQDGTVPGMPDWRYIHTPGHTPGHISLFRDEDRTLIAGDAFVTVKQESLFKVVTQIQEISGPPKYFTTDWGKAWTSVRKLEALKPTLAVTGHGVPMQGEELTRQLGILARDFDRMAIPEHGRFLQ